MYEVYGQFENIRFKLKLKIKHFIRSESKNESNRSSSSKTGRGLVLIECYKLWAIGNKPAEEFRTI